MAQQQQNLTIPSPGYYGLNTEESPLQLDPGYALVADNAVVDSNGRIGNRKAFAEFTTALNLTYSTDPTTETTSIVAHRMGSVVINGVTKVLVTVSVLQTDATNALVQEDYFLAELNEPSAEVYELDEITLPTVTTPSRLTDAKIVGFNDVAYIFSEGNDVLVYDGTACTNLSAAAGFLPPQDNGGNIANKINGGVVCSAYGRLWVSGVDGDDQTIYYSDLLIATQWYDGKTTPTDPLNTAGIIDVSEYWPNGSDRIVNIVAHNGLLLVFGRQSTLVYSGVSEDPASANGLQLQDAISNIGLVSRDAVAIIGSDVLFVDDSGLRSIGRTIQEKSAPIGSLSVNVHKDFTNLVASTGDKSKISLSYWISENLLVVNFAEQGLAYTFESRNPSPSGGLKATRWVGCRFERTLYYEEQGTARILLASNADNTGLMTYDGFIQYDNEPYEFKYESGQLTFGSPSNTKFLKQIDYTLASTVVDASATAEWGYSGTLDYAKRFNVRATQPALYGVAQYGIDVFGGAQVTIRRYKTNTKGSGESVVVGFRIDINGNSCSLQELNVQTLIGRLN